MHVMLSVFIIKRWSRSYNFHYTTVRIHQKGFCCNKKYKNISDACMYTHNKVQKAAITLSLSAVLLFGPVPLPLVTAVTCMQSDTAAAAMLFLLAGQFSVELSRKLNVAQFVEIVHHNHHHQHQLHQASIAHSVLAGRCITIHLV